MNNYYLPLLKKGTTKQCPEYIDCKEYVNNYVYGYNFISFRQNNLSQRIDTKLSKIQLMNEGYELPEIQNNKIKNYGRYILLSSNEDIEALANTPSAWSKEFVLVSDVDMKDSVINGIGNAQKPFTGIFNGNGYKIKNLSIDNSFSSNVGLFKICNNAEIMNLSLENASVKGRNNVGCVAGSAENGTNITNVRVNGKINGEKYAGGIVGNLLNSTISRCIFDGSIKPPDKIVIEDEENDFFEEVYESSKTSVFGGLCGIAVDSDITESQVAADVTSSRNTGGIAGILNECLISDCACYAEVKGNDGVGIIAGKANDSIIKNSYIHLNIPFIGEIDNCKIEDCVTGIEDLYRNVHEKWNNEIWNVSPYKLPRLKLNLNEISPVKIFIQDVQNDVLNKNIIVGEFHYNPPKLVEIPLENMEPPEHYSQNDEILEEIKNSDSEVELATIFSYWTDGFRRGFSVDNKEIDEILLALIRNPHFNMSRRCKQSDGGPFSDYTESVYCTPLYVLSCLNKGFLFNEALKRKDLNMYVKNGYYENVDIYESLCKYPIATNMFLLFNSQNQIVREYVKTRLKELPDLASPDKLINILRENPLGTVTYNDVNHSVYVPSGLLCGKNDIEDIHFRANDKFNTLLDVLKSIDIPVDYQDSLGNTAAHVLSDLSEEEQLLYLQMYNYKNGNINIKNKDGYSPVQLAILNRQHNLYSKILEMFPSDMFYKDADGNNALLLNVKENKSKKLMFNINLLHNLGFSVNMQDSDGSTPLMEAIKNNDLKAVNYLLTNGAEVDMRDSNGQTALHHAFIQKNTRVIKWLLDKYAYPNVRDNLGMLPKDYWDEYKIECQKECIDVDAITDEYKLIFDDENIIANSNISDVFEPFKVPDVNNIFDFVHSLGSDYNKIYYTICRSKDYIASNEGLANDISEYLLQSNIPFIVEIINKFIQDKSLEINKINNAGQTLLITALKCYYNTNDNANKINLMKVIKLLLDNNANIDIADENNQTALHHAIFTHNIVLFNELLGKHPNINAADSLGKNPLFYLGDDIASPMRIVFNKYAEKRGITLPDNTFKMITKSLKRKI